MTSRETHGSTEDAQSELGGSERIPRTSDKRETKHSRSDPSDAGGTQQPRPIELLVVGTFAGGGIHRYIEEQVEQFQESVSVKTHDMDSPPMGDGTARFVRGVFLGVVAFLSFPFRDRPDIVHVHTSHQYSFYHASPYVLYAQYVWDVPVIVHIHGSSFDVFMKTDSLIVAWLQQAVFAGSDEILVLSEFWKDAVSKRADPDKIRVLPNVVEPARFPVGQSQTGGDEEGVPHIVFLSNLIERKGVCELVEALEELARTHPGQFRASIAGTGSLKNRVEKLADAHEEISYLGYVSKERKRSLLAEGSIYVLPTYAEGLPIAMLEGMAGANAIVSTGVGSIPEVIDENRGLLVEPGDIDGLTEALATLITAPERRREMAANNRRAVETEYSWNTVRDEWIGIYETHT